MTKTRTTVLLSLAVLFMASLAGCAGDDAPTTPTETPEPTETEAPQANTTVDPQTAPPEEIPVDTTTTWYLHHTGGCAGADGEVEFADRVDSTGDDDGCGSIGPGNTIGGAVYTFTATEESPAYTTGTHVNASLFLSFDQPTHMEIQAVLLAGETPLGSAVDSWDVVFPGTYAPFYIEFDTEGEIPAGTILTLEVHPYIAVSSYMGYEEDHASRLTLG